MQFRMVSLVLGATLAAGCREKEPAPRPPQRESMTIASPAPADSGALHKKTLAILATDGFEEVELVTPQKMFAEEGAKTVVVSTKPGVIQGFNHRSVGNKVLVEMTLDQADPNTFDGLVLPSGLANPDELRMDPRAVRFVRAFAEARKPIAAICHAPW